MEMSSVSSKVCVLQFNSIAKEGNQSVLSRHLLTQNSLRVLCEIEVTGPIPFPQFVPHSGPYFALQ